MKYLLLALLLSAVYAAAQVSYPVGTVISVTDDGVTVTAPSDDDDDEQSDNSASTTTETGLSPAPNASGYCSEDGVDYSTVNCQSSNSLDNFYAFGGERVKRIPAYSVLAMPFTTGESAEDTDISGYFQITSGERSVDPKEDPMFKVWFSATPGGAPLSGEKCLLWARRAKLNHYWTHEVRYADQVCKLPHDTTLYYNAAVECLPSKYEGYCDAEAPVRNTRTYIFDLAKRYVVKK
jgi:hypothetical protein